MPETSYTYSIASDFPNGQVHAGNLDLEIRNSSIASALKYVVINPDDDDVDRVDVVFKKALTAGEKTVLDNDATAPSGGLIAAHDSTEKTPMIHAELEMATIEDPSKKVQRIAVQPARTHYYMNFRDFRLNTGIYDGAESFEDLKVNPSTNEREAWDEMSFVGCYKGDDNSGYTLCTDQADADTNATLSIWDFLANDQQNTPANVDIDMMGGVLWVDPSLAEPNAGDIWKHQFYALMAPNIPTFMGGAVPFFDSYLYPHQGEWTEALNTLAVTLDPSASAEAARIRFWIYYPAGAKQTHVLGLKIYRNKW